MNFSEIVNKGIDKIYAEDFESQKFYLKTVLGTVRKMDNVDVMIKAKSFFVPNNEYLKKYFGVECLSTEMDIYNWHGTCYWDNMIVIPIKNIIGRIAGFVGFDAITKSKRESGLESDLKPYYRYSSSNVFNRSKYIYFLEGEYERAIQEKYAIITDGVFDKLSFSQEGLISGSLLGSVVSDEIIFQLLFIETLYIAEDNDAAGRDLYLKLKRIHPNVKYIRQNVFGDADDILKSEYKEEYLRKVKEIINNRDSLTLRMKPLKALK